MFKRLSNTRWTSSSPAAFIGTHINKKAQRVFDKHLNIHGFDLHDVAILAASLENLVHIEARERLQAAYELIGGERSDGIISEEEARRTMHTYLLMYVLQNNYHYSFWTPELLNKINEKIDKIYPMWNSSAQFLEEIRKAVLEEEAVSAGVDGVEDADGTPHSWNVMLKALERFGESYGRFQNQECVEMKRQLQKMEISNIGRVPLHRFYEKVSSDGSWMFSESIPYLRQLGALDESDRNRPSVIIPNYLLGASQCVAGSKFYDVCCINECEELVSHLEKQLAAPKASPGQIAKLVAQLPSDSISAPRTLPQSLLQRLEQVAEHHEGLVPLHGRLFAQWMHHAYPHECPYPYVSGTTNSMTPMEWKLTNGYYPRVKSDEALVIVNDANAQSAAGDRSDETELPWSSEEELVICRPELRDNAANGNIRIISVGRLGLLFPPLFCMVFMLMRFVRRAKPSLDSSNADIHYL